MCEITDTIRSMAAEGKSRAEIAEAIGVTKASLRKLCEYLGPLEFNVKEVRGVRGTLPKLVAHFGTGVSSDLARWRLKSGFSTTWEHAIFTPTGKLFTVRGNTGTVRELIEFFELDIEPHRVLYRLRQGYSQEEAFLNPVRKISRG